jgi:hypothetical protein
VPVSDAAVDGRVVAPPGLHVHVSGVAVALSVSVVAPVPSVAVSNVVVAGDGDMVAPPVVPVLAPDVPVA